MPKSIYKAFDIPAGPHAQNAEWLASDWRVDDIGKFRFNIAMNTASIIQYTIDGTNFVSLNGNEPLIANSVYGFDIYVRPADLINFRTPTAGSHTVLIGRLDSVKDEG